MIQLDEEEEMLIHQSDKGDGQVRRQRSGTVAATLE